mmetsp:Transcript_18940/g.27717  ORF Transcript_18940/g.27717 Transcript_18940/m.27717 type:complete len:123 (+) Transcript_18940:146-514(+)|eukprot:CAMPEP_0195507862 /NCGR_PEP_ID=MMETSP0794_2-20130614/1220_1 /TAXON_ID=515487 /ORGANISM="Stephanopyxis turris, Strain CCMP 815" /LENGTH=122 /DNA_ID=CAMNT_0040634679 /DNA_START=145 /DNA_END=513 /DNA_ORIENTATION=+
MNNLSSQQKDELATSLAILALYDGQAEVSSDQINSLLTATNNSVEAYYPVIFANLMSQKGKIVELICTPGGSGGGGGGGGDGDAGGAEEAEEEEKEEEKEEEMDLGGGMDMFGGDEAGDGNY